ncbi:MAG: DNA-3-methyladenine glycosylase [Gemmatimonadota bacterium]|nr:DNA-3-methyladenine glycosylase [Gemmatimonadota bacterium]MDH5197090.1 DNA-3-methyladenine glycosylase [Gemmatimonadota bacterium]
MAPPLPRSFFARDTVRVARALLGCVLETRYRRTVTAGRIVEVEAYVGPHDPAAHGYRNRRSERNASMFGRPGTAYVYFIYGMHWCFNVVTEREGVPAAVLIRALEPIAGLAAMCRRRRTRDRRLLCSGPARLCQALGIAGGMDGLPLDGPRLCIRPPVGGPSGPPTVTPRIGIRHASDWPLRFAETGSPWTSRPEPRGGSGRDRTRTAR